ncbi:unnamed protein product [Toxocara canis]|uniref:ANF_receptor domain-containing protein n=1 Tax=Toxocara canis TaxID=6265 RepID=A0A183VBX2_TOXCA|nr:unnamed protein product [Toxocara canis]
MEAYNWTDFALVYSTAGSSSMCDGFQSDLKNFMQTVSAVIVYSSHIDLQCDECTNRVLNNLRLRARIVVMCFDENEQSNGFLRAIYDHGMANAEYVYINLKPCICDAAATNNDYMQKVNSDRKLQEALKYTLTIKDVAKGVSLPMVFAFESELKRRMEELAERFPGTFLQNYTTV